MSFETFYLLQIQHLYKARIKVHISSTLKCLLHVRSFIRGPWDCQIQESNSLVSKKTTFNNDYVTDSVSSATVLLPLMSDSVYGV